MTTTTAQDHSHNAATVPTAAARYSVDAAHSHVSFAIRHMMISNVRGEFQKFSGEVTYDVQHPEATQIAVSIDIGSINTREEKRDAHLRSADFFDAENHPTMTYVSRQVTRHGDGLQVVGDLTLRGTTREVTLTIEELTPEHSDPWGNRRIGASARGKLRRSEFGLRWNAALEAGGVLVGDEVTIQLDVQLVRQK